MTRTDLPLVRLLLLLILAAALATAIAGFSWDGTDAFSWTAPDTAALAGS